MRGMLRTGGRVLAFAAIALLLSGCLKLDEHLTLHPDNTVDGTVTFGVSKQLIQMTGQSASDVLSQMTASGAPVPSGVPNVQTSDYSDDTFVGKTYTFSGASLDQINGQGGDLKITRDKDNFVVDGTLDLSSGQAGIDLNDPTTKTMLQTFQVSIAITFPGAVSDAGSGTVDGNTVTWTPKIGETTQIHAVGSAIATSSSSLLLYVLIGVVVLILVIVLVVLASRRRKEPTTPAMTGFGDETAPVAPMEGEGQGMPVAPIVAEPATIEPAMTEHEPAEPPTAETAMPAAEPAAPEPPAGPAPGPPAPEPPAEPAGSEGAAGPGMLVGPDVPEPPSEEQPPQTPPAPETPPPPQG